VQLKKLNSSVHYRNCLLCFVGVLKSTMKQVGLGRGCIRPPVTQDRQLAVSGSRFATASPAFDVDALVGRPNIRNGGIVKLH